LCGILHGYGANAVCSCCAALLKLLDEDVPKLDLSNVTPLQVVCRLSNTKCALTNRAKYDIDKLLSIQCLGMVCAIMHGPDASPNPRLMRAVMEVVATRYSLRLHTPLRIAVLIGLVTGAKGNATNLKQLIEEGGILWKAIRGSKSRQ
jgi:hypothetical protein